MGKIRNSIGSTISRLFLGDGGQSFLSWGAFGGLGKKNRYELLKEYRNIVSNCIEAIAEDVAQYEPVFFKKDGRTAKKNILATHEFMKVLESPNPDTTQYELFEATQSFIELTGEAFWYVTVGERNRKPMALDLIRPDRVKVAIDKVDGSVGGYTVRRDDGIEIPLEVDEVIHFKTFNPVNPYRGIGTVEKGLLYVETEHNTSLFQRNFLRNQATPSGVLSLKGNIKKEAFDKVKAKWAEQQSGLANVGKTLFIREVDAKFEKVGLALNDLNMEQLTKLSEDKVYRMFKVPKAIVGETDSSGLGRANIDTIEYIFAKRTIDPKMIRIDDTLRLAVRKYYKDEGLYIEHVSQVPEDKEAKLAENDKGVNRWVTINEVRREKGLDPVDGGDKLYVEFNKVPVDEIGSGETGSSDKSFGKIIRRKVVVSKDAAQETFFQALEKVEDKATKDYKKKLKALLKEQEARVIELVSQQGGGKGLKVYDESMPDENEEAKAFAEALVPLLLLAMQQSGELAVEFIGVSDIEFAISQATRDAVFSSTQRLLKSFTAQTVKKLQKQLAEGLANQETVQQLTKRIESVYKEAAGFRATRIATTEAHKASNAAVAEAYKMSGIKRMQWQIRDGGACEFCRSMNGSIITIGSSFVPKGGTIEGEDGGSYLNDYDDIKYADAHPNCRCQLLPVRDDD